MGDVKRLLFSDRLATLMPSFYANKRSIELAETLHHHERNIRLEYKCDQFQAMCSSLHQAHSKHITMGSPESHPKKTVYLCLSDLNPIPSVTPDRFDIEECTYPTLPETTIHLHYRNLRLEFSHAEWAEFAEGVRFADMNFHDDK